MSEEAPQLIAALDHLLLQEIDAYQQLVALQRDAPRPLLTQAPDLFLISLQARDHLTRHLNQVEQQRAEVTSRLAAVLDLEPGEVTLLHLSTQIAEPYASRFRAYRDQLRLLVAELQQLSRYYTQLLRDALTFVDSALGFFAALQPTPATYLQSGKLPTPTQGRLLSGRI